MTAIEPTPDEIAALLQVEHLLDQRWPNTDRQDAVFGAYIKAVGGFVTLLDGYPRLRDVMAARDYAMPMPEDVVAKIRDRQQLAGEEVERIAARLAALA